PPAGDCHSKPLWRETLFVALREGHPLTEAEGVRWPELTGESFLARSSGAGPQVYDHIVLRVAAPWSKPRVQQFDVERDTLMSMVAQGYGITLTTEGPARVLFPGVVFQPILDEREPITFSALWSPHNRNQASASSPRACAAEIRGQINRM